MRMDELWKRFVYVLCLIMASSTFALAQDASGKILGQVTDPQGASLAGARVVVTNTGTQVSRETVTDKDGNFQILSLPIGVYTVSAEKDGFKKVVSSEENLKINQALRIDLKLEVGANTEIIEVSSQGVLVETVNPTLGQSVTARPLVNLPLNGRNMLSLALLQPGVVDTNSSNGTVGVQGVSIAGGRVDSVSYLLDGGNNNSLLSNGVVFNPNPDTVAEFRILTSNYTAEYGRNGGGVISIVTKSGTNEYHGSAFDFVRNDAFNANSFFNKRNGLPREILKRHQFGFTVGGPISIPGLFSGKDRFFFFAGYQGQRQTQAQTTEVVQTFTPAELNGDFSLSGGGRPDPGVVDFLKQFPYFQPNASLAARGIIDPSRINSVARNYISNKLVPTSPTGELVSQSTAKNDSDELTFRLDFNFTSNDKLAVTLGSGRNPQNRPFSYSNVTGFPVSDTGNRYFSNFTYTKIISAALLNEARMTVQRLNTTRFKPAVKLPTPAELGIGVTPDRPGGPSQIEFDKGLILGFSPNGPQTIINNTFTYTDTVSWQKGNHNFKFGGAFSPYQNNTLYDFYVNGAFFLYGASDGGFTGNDFADFLLGLPNEYLQFGSAPSNIRTKSAYAFAQDEWRVRPNLTLSLGVRYEYAQPKFDTQGRSFSLRFGAKSQVFTDAPLGLLFPGDPNAPKGSNFSDKNDWAPRFGFAWDPFKDGKTSVRGGFGVFYDILKGEDNLQFNGQAPFFGFADLFFDPISKNPTKEVNYFSQPFVATGVPNSFPSRPPAPNVNFADSGFLPVGGGGVFYVDQNLRTPYVFQYNLSIQRQLVRNLMFEANYTGSSSRKLTGLVDANPFVGSKRLFNTLPGNSDISFSYLDEFRNVATGHYDSLQLSLQKQLSETKYIGNTYFTFAYTYAHNIDNASGYRERNSTVPAFNPGIFRSSADTDVRHRVTLSGGWDIPLDRWFPKVWDRVTKGWSVYPIFSYRTGFPLDVFASLRRSRTTRGPSGAGDAQLVRANLVGNNVGTFDAKQNQIFRGRNGNFYFNPDNFNRDGLVGYGTLPRNFFTGPGRTNFDLAFAKTTAIIKEKVNLEFRAEFFNVFNTVQFQNPSTNISSSQFGQITTTYDPRIVQLAARLTF
ncbi:MAG: carboxypeptidase regulatory-like domain-containing protein [Blastocatellia bacterium]|nr:carboxypeptidase regulatory-like domain-containing protein [Blastocatellia bacterium]